MVILAFAVTFGFLKMFYGQMLNLFTAGESRNKLFWKKQSFGWLFRRFFPGQRLNKSTAAVGIKCF